MRRPVLCAATALLLAAPTALAFRSGGYFAEPRLIATVGAWVLVVVVAVAAPVPLPRSRPGRLAAGSLVFLAVWTGISLAWAPLSGPATDYLVRMILYAGALLVAAALLRARGAALAVEPALALGSVVVIGYGLAGRSLPGVLDLARSVRAGDRLEQPITYWNSEGALAAMGLVLCVRLAGSTWRPVWMRAVAAAGSAPLALGIYLSYSRGAAAAVVAGLIVLAAMAPSRPQLRAGAVAALGAAVAVGAGAALPAVASLQGSTAGREAQGAAMLAILLAAMGASAFAQARIAAAERRRSAGAETLAIGRPLWVAAAAAVVLALGGLVAGGLGERAPAGDPTGRQGASRLTSFQSRRYDYWRAGVRAWRDQPLRGIGAGGFRVAWLRERPLPEAASEIHSLPLEMGVELGVPGLLGFLALLAGIAVAGRRALGRRPELAPGPAAVVMVFFLHSAIDWDWQLPAVALVAIIATGALVAEGEAEPGLSEVERAPASRSGSAA